MIIVPNLKVEMQAGLLAVCKYGNTQVNLGIIIRFMFYEGLRIYVDLSRNQYLVRNDKSVSHN